MQRPTFPTSFKDSTFVAIDNFGRQYYTPEDNNTQHQFFRDQVKYVYQNKDFEIYWVRIPEKFLVDNDQQIPEFPTVGEEVLPGFILEEIFWRKNTGWVLLERKK